MTNIEKCEHYEWQECSACMPEPSVCPMVDCDNCGVTLDRKGLPMPERNQCLECLDAEAVAYDENKTEKALGL